MTDAPGRATRITRITRDSLGRPTFIERTQTGQPTLCTQQRQVISSAFADHSRVRAVGFSYVPSGAGAGELTSITYPSGAVLSYQYDATGALNDMRWNGQLLLRNIAYNALGQPLSWTWRLTHASASLPASRSYNPAGQLISSEDGATRHWYNGQHQPVL